MARISGLGRISGDQLGLLRNLSQAGSDLSRISERLSTMKRINRAKDDPSGLVVASKLQAELTALESSSQSITRANSLIDTADAAMADVVSKLGDARTLALDVAGGNLSASEKAGKQAQLDDILESIDRVAKTSFNGTRLLDGTSGYRVLGINTAQFLDIDVVAKRITGNTTVSVNVTTTALRGTRAYAGGTLGAATTLQITGSEGTATIELANGSTTEDIADAFNAVSGQTGITAAAPDGTNVNFTTTKYGSRATMTITALAGSFSTTGTGTGRDAVANIDGTSVTADGTSFTASLPNYTVQFDVAPTVSGALTNFTIAGDGLEFNLSGNPNDVARLGLMSMTTATLGGSTGKLTSLKSGMANAIDTGSVTNALTVIDDALSEARLSQARLGSFSKYQIDSANTLNQVQQETTTAAYEDIMNIDVAEETARLSRQQLLQSAATQALQVSMLQSTSVLSVLQSIAFR